MLRQRGEKQADGKWFIDSAERNKGPILDILARVLPRQGVVLEVASGTGQHVLHFAKALPGLAWQPSDPDPELRESIALRVKEQQLANVNRPIDLDVSRLPWPLQTADAVVCINMIHVAPWSATLALLEGTKAARTAASVSTPPRVMSNSIQIFVRTIPSGVFGNLRRCPRLLLRPDSCSPRSSKCRRTTSA